METMSPWPKDTNEEILKSLVKKWVRVSISYGNVQCTVSGELNYTEVTKKFIVNGNDNFICFKAEDVTENNDYDGNNVFLKNPKFY